MTQQKSLIKPKSRLEWTDLDWANYLCCSIQEIPSIRKFLDDNYVTAIERNKTTGRYSFAMYKYHTAPSGAKDLHLMLSDDKHSFSNLIDAMHDANNIISTLEFSDFWAKTLNVPKQSLQMMLIREK